jgi:hypothetical protein
MTRWYNKKKDAQNRVIRTFTVKGNWYITVRTDRNEYRTYRIN